MITTFKKPSTKVSIEFTNENRRLLQEYASSTNTTIVNVANMLIEIFLCAPRDVKKDLYDFSIDRENEIIIYDKNLQSAVNVNSKEIRRVYQQLGSFWLGDFIIPSFRGQEKMKATIKFENNNYFWLLHYTASANTTIGRFFNYLISVILNIPQEVKFELAAHCAEKTQKINKSLPSISNSFLKLDAENNIRYFQRINYFWSNGEPAELPETKKIFLKNGWLSCPADWIVLDDALHPAAESTRAFVIECQYSEKYEIPHFTFFGNKSVDEITEVEKERIYDACETAWPKFKSVRENQTPPTDLPASDSEFAKEVTRHLECPYIGIFEIISDNSPLYREFDSYPYSCILHRN